MKIGMVTTQFAEVGGVENVVRSLSKELSGEHDVYLITRDRGVNTEDFEDCFEEVYEIEGTEGYIDFLFKGRKFLRERENEFDVLHFHNWSPILPALGLDIPMVLTYHGTTFDVKMSEGKYLKAIFYWVLEEFALNIPDQVTSITKSHLRPFFAFKNVEIIRNGVDTDFYRPGKRDQELRNKWDVEGKGILIVGKHIEPKNHSKLIKAAAELEIDSTLMIPSDGPLREKLEKKAEIVGVNANFYGKVSDEELRELYQSADLFCLPSKNEGLPLTMLEALSTGLPVLVSNIADNRRIVEESAAGSVIKKDLREELKTILESDLEEKSGNARNYALSNLSWKKISRIYEEVYEKAR